MANRYEGSYRTHRQDYGRKGVRRLHKAMKHSEAMGRNADTPHVATRKHRVTCLALGFCN